ncbi:MAG: hypothetical protein R2882_09860 [Gemmatimonadales bacterium]
MALAALHRDGSRQPSFTLASVVEDEPLSVTTPAGRWQPTNYDRTFRGECDLPQRLEQSLNVPFARVGLAVGPERIVLNRSPPASKARSRRCRVWPWAVRR